MNYDFETENKQNNRTTLNLIVDPSRISKIGGAILFLIPQIVNFYFFYFIVPEISDGHAHQIKMSMYTGPPNIVYRFRIKLCSSFKIIFD